MKPEALLKASGIGYKVFPLGGTQVFVSGANQLFGSHAQLTEARKGARAYSGWEAHHVFERADIRRLNAVTLFPSYGDQLCVLIPSMAHRDRINQVLRSENSHLVLPTPQDLHVAYTNAYELLGNYSGGGASNIQRELVSIVDTALSYVTTSQANRGGA